MCDSKGESINITNFRALHSPALAPCQCSAACIPVACSIALRVVCCLGQGVVLRMATFVVLRYGSTLSKISVHRFFTLCWMRVSAACARWRSLRSPAWRRSGYLPGGSSGAAADAGLLATSSGCPQCTCAALQKAWDKGAIGASSTLTGTSQKQLMEQLLLQASLPYSAPIPGHVSDRAELMGCCSTKGNANKVRRLFGRPSMHFRSSSRACSCPCSWPQILTR